jgi:hypothetical protein
MTSESEALSALDRILAGDWDRFLHRLHGAIHIRQKTEEYVATIIVGVNDD